MITAEHLREAKARIDELTATSGYIAGEIGEMHGEELVEFVLELGIASDTPLAAGVLVGLMARQIAQREGALA